MASQAVHVPSPTTHQPSYTELIAANGTFGAGTIPKPDNAATPVGEEKRSLTQGISAQSSSVRAHDGSQTSTEANMIDGNVCTHPSSVQEVIDGHKTVQLAYTVAQVGAWTAEEEAQRHAKL